MGGTLRQTKLFVADSPGTTSEHASRIFDVIAVVFVTLLLILNIAVTKMMALDAGSIRLVFSGGMVLSPLTYVLGDIPPEAHGFARVKQVTILGSIISVLISLIFLLVRIAPIGPGYGNQTAFEAVFGFVPHIVAASVIDYPVRQLVNFFILVKIRQRWGAECLWARLIDLTLPNETFDAVLFYTTAFVGIIPDRSFFSCMLTGYVYKTGMKVVPLPITYHAVVLVEKHEDLKPEEVLAA